MHTLVKLFAVFLFWSANVGNAHAEEMHPHWAVSFNAGYVGAFNLERELAFDTVLVGNMPIGGAVTLYLEAGLGTTFGVEQTYTLPLGMGVWYELNDSVALGLAASYCSQIGHFSEGGFLVGPLVQYTMLEHTGPFGHASLVAIPGMAGQFHHGGRFSGFGLGFTLGVEVEL